MTSGKKEVQRDKVMKLSFCVLKLWKCFHMFFVVAFWLFTRNVKKIREKNLQKI